LIFGQQVMILNQTIMSFGKTKIMIVGQNNDVLSKNNEFWLKIMFFFVKKS